MNKIAILQPNYIPWKGVFDLINQVDIFVFLDDVQYTNRDWRNRNKIRTPEGSSWVTVPIEKESNTLKIKDVKISENSNWQNKHYKSFCVNYSNSKYLKKYKYLIDKIYIDKIWNNLSELNIFSTKIISELLEIKTKFILSSSLNINTYKKDKILDICKKLDANYYLSGPSAKNYLELSEFTKNNIKLDYIKYEYPEYIQLYNKFEHGVTVLDVLLNCGEKSRDYIFMNKTENDSF